MVRVRRDLVEVVVEVEESLPGFLPGGGGESVDDELFEAGDALGPRRPPCDG
ncbi:hypothetical protein [Micromonospora tulbaghiae]|uniref:hypothetical protein n=1 Tax=Micromonospora tulbaghiae TaxID=479978 RepID=UPI0013C40F29|nr:hypothetical protein [Micromonospora tulbaghiae]